MTDRTDTPRTDSVWYELQMATEFQLAVRMHKHAEQLERELSSERASRIKAEEERDRLLDSECDKIMAMPENRVEALIASTGQRPEDAAKLAWQAAKIALLQHDLKQAEARAEQARQAALVQAIQVVEHWLEEGNLMHNLPDELRKLRGSHEG